MSSRRITFFDGFTSEITPDTVITTLTDSDAIHDNVSGEINAIDEKTNPVDDDVMIIEDSAASFGKKRVKFSNLPGAAGGESNTASNVGSGTGKVFKQKTGIDLQFKSIAATANETTVSNGTDDVTVGLASGIDAAKIGDASVTNTIYNQIPSLGSTTWQSGGEITINGGDTAKYDVAAGTGFIYDPITDTRTDVSWGAKSAVTPGNLGTEVVTTISIDVNGDIFESNVDQTNEERRTFICLGSILHVDMAEITATFDEPAYTVGPGVQLYDLYKSLGFINISGNDYSSAASVLTLNKSAGVIEGPGVNIGNLKAPNTKSTPANTPLTWFYNFVTAGAFTVVEGVTSIDPNQFNDPALGLVSMPNNQFQIKRFFYSGSNETTVIQYGQATYSSIAEAEASLNTEIFNKNPQLSTFPLRGYLIVKQGTTDLTNASNARFITGQKIDLGGAGGGASTSTTTLQGAYNNSAEPIITLSATPGEICIRDASSPIGGVLFEIEKFDESVKYFEVHADKVSVTNPFEIKNGNELRFFDSGNSNHVGFVAPSLVADQIWILPDADGSANQVFTTDGAGNITWETPAGSGETNTASSDGGTSLVKAKVGVDLRFKGLTATSTKIGLTSNTNDIGIDVIEANIDHDALSGFVANEHLDWTADLGATNINAANITEGSVTQHEAAIDHDALSGFVANEHLDHTSISVIAGDGLSGGGTIAANRTFDIDISPQSDIGTPANGDFLLIEDVTDGSIKKVQAGEFINFGATTALDNLGAVAINTSLVSDTDNTDDLGTDAKEWKDLWVHGIKHNDAGSPDLTIETTGNNGGISITPTGSGILNMGADSGDVFLFTNSGTLLFQDGSEGTTGDVWTSTGTLGEGNWETPTAGDLTGHITSNGLATLLGSFTSAQLATALTNETGSGSAVFANGATLIAPVLGTPASGVMTNVTGTASGLTAGNVTTNANLTGDVTSSGNATTYAGIVPVNKGGTGESTATAGFDALQPMTTGGDIIFGGASGTGTRLANGSANQVLTSAGGTAAPTWENAASGFTDPMTTRGDIIIRNASNVTDRLPVGTNTQVLTSDGTDITWEDAAGGGASEATPTTLGTTTSYISTVQDKVKTVTSANYTILDTDGFDTILVSTSTTNRTITLPTAADNEGKEIFVSKTDDTTGTVILDGEGSETIDGLTIQTLYNQFERIKVVCDGTSWHIVDRRIARSTIQTLTLTAGTGIANLTANLATGYAYADENNNWRLVFNVRANFDTSGAGSIHRIAITGVTFTNTTKGNQVIVSSLSEDSPLTTQFIDNKAYVELNTGNIVMIDFQNGNDLAGHYSGDVLLDSKPTWA